MDAQDGYKEGQSTTRPPYFNGTNYVWWSNRMENYIQSKNMQLWLIVENGPFKIVKTEGDKEVPKSTTEYVDSDLEKLEKNAKAIKLLHCALGPEEYNRVSACKTAKEIWDALRVAHEGTNQVKKARIDLLVHQYELFKMNDGESISDMSTRFTKLTNELANLGKTYSNEERNRKILRSLPSAWLPKVTAIQEAKDLAETPLEQIMGSLAVHEELLKQHSGNDAKKEKSIVLMADDKYDDDDIDPDDINVDDEMALITRGITRIFRATKGNKKWFKPRRNRNTAEASTEKKQEKLICFKCQKPGHIIRKTVP